MNPKITSQPFVDAYLIHQKPYLEKKLIIYLFTKEHGLVPAVTHHSKEKRNNLTEFSKLSCQLLIKPSLSQLKKIEIKQFHPPLRGSYLFAGLYINELIYRLCQANQANEELYHLYMQSIQNLSQQKPLSKEVRMFEYQIQHLLGYGLNFECLDQTHDNWFYFTPDTGLKPSISKQTQLYQRKDLENLEAGQLSDPETQQCSKKIFSQLITHLLGKNNIFIKNIMPKKDN